MALLKLIALCFIITIVSREVACVISLELLLKLQLVIPSLQLTDIVGKCLDYPTQNVPQNMIEKSWYAVASITSTTCTNFTVKATIQSAKELLQIVNVSYMNETGYITTGQFIRQEFAPGLYVLKQYTADNQLSLNGILPTYVVAVLEISADSILLYACPIKPTTEHEVLTIFTTTGEDTSSVIPFESYTRNQDISTDTFQHLNLPQCAGFYP